MTEIIKCPSCQKPLQLPEAMLGQTVQCPQCRHQFTATSAAVSSTPAPPPAPKPGMDDDDRRAPEPRQSRYDEDEYDDITRPSLIRRELAPHRGGMILAFGLVSLVGGFIIGLPFIFGIFAWIMGNNDLAEIRAGRMDPSGEGMVQAGRILGIISVTFAVLGVLLFCSCFSLALVNG